MRVVSIVGTRPQFVKLAAFVRSFPKGGAEHLVIHTGQHRDYAMSEGFIDSLDLPRPHVELEIVADSPAHQIGLMIMKLDRILREIAPDIVVNYGDTNTTLAGALAAAKAGIPSAHVEAGLRSRRRDMQEEINRIVTDHTSSLCIAPTPTALSNLCDEGLGERSVMLGDLMSDVLWETVESIERTPDRSPVINGEFIFATIHRAENTDDPNRLTALVHALERLNTPVLFAVHPRLRERATAIGLCLGDGALVPIEPMSYLKLVSTLLTASAVVTDSGGLQKEAFALGVPCTTVRPTTEWPETLAMGANILCDDPNLLSSIALRKSHHQRQPRPAPVASGIVSAVLKLARSIEKKPSS